MRFAALLGTAAALASLEFDWFYRQCNSLTIANAAIKSKCSTSSNSTASSNTTTSSNSTRSSNSTSALHKRAAKTSIPASCYCPLDDYQESMYECFVYAKNMSGAPEKSIRESWNYLRKACKNSKGGVIRTWDEIQTLVATTPVTQSFKEAAKAGKGAFFPNTTAITQESTSAYIERHWQYYWQEIFGMITVWYVCAIMLVQAIFHWGAYFAPGFIRILFNNPMGRQLRRHVALPALFNKHRSAPLKVARYFMLCFPPRIQSLLLAGYVFLCIFFLAFHYPHIMGTNYWDSYKQLVSAYLALRSGNLAMYKMPFVYLFAGRNNILIWITGWQFEVFNHWHRWIARLFTIDVFIHGIAYSIDFNTTGRFPGLWYKTYMKWGGVGFVAMCFLCLNGTKTMRQLAYETFLYIHIVLAVLTCVGTFYHVLKRQGCLLQYAAWAFWAADRFFRLCKILLSNPMSKAHIKAHPGGTLEITIKYSGWWKPTAGTYIFIHFLHPLYFIQSHPFTVVPVDEKGEMKLYAKALKGITRTLYNRAEKAGGECDYRVLVEGPYGVSFSTKQYKEVVLLAGGIGVTAIYSHLQHIVKSDVDQIIHVHWAMSSPEPLSWFKEEIDRMTSHCNVHVIVHMADAQNHISKIGSRDSEEAEKKDTQSATISVDGLSFRSVSFRPSYNQIISDHIEHSQGDIVFFVCGPHQMTDSVRDSVTNNMFKTRNMVQYFEESFSM